MILPLWLVWACWETTFGLACDFYDYTQDRVVRVMLKTIWLSLYRWVRL